MRVAIAHMEEPGGNQVSISWHDLDAETVDIAVTIRKVTHHFLVPLSYLFEAVNMLHEDTMTAGPTNIVLGDDDMEGGYSN